MNGTGTLSSLTGSATLQTAGGGAAFNCADLLECPSFTDLQTEIAAASLAVSGLETSVANLETEVAGKFDIPTGTASDYLNGAGTPTPFPAYVNSKAVFREVRNETGATLTKGTVVYISGASGNKATVSKAIATSDATSAQTFGVIYSDLPTNQNGVALVFGEIAGLNTSAYAEGTQLYLSATTAGDYTSVKQYAPNHLVYIGVVTRQHANQGSIEIKIQNGYELDELHDVQAQNPADRNGLFFELSSNQWKARAIASADVPNLDAAKITSGTFDAARIPTLDASKTGTGTFDAARIPSLDSSKITSGSFDTARIPNLDSSKITTGTFATARIPKAILPALIYTGAALAGNPGNNIETVIQTLSIPAGSLSAGDIIRIGFLYSFTGNAGTKTPRIRIGSNTIVGNAIFGTSALAASITNIQAEVLAVVTSATNLRIWQAANNTGFGASTVALTNNTVDLNQAIPFSFNILKATGTDTAILEFVFIEILKQ